MDESRLARLKAIGHWRVNFRPTKRFDDRLSLGDCAAIVGETKVTLRGWDFPHVSHRNDDDGGFIRSDKYVENWTDWYGFLELWRMYRSGQFLSRNALREDTIPSEYGNPSVPVLHIVPTIYSIVEFVEFAHRLTKRGIYDTGVALSIRLIGANGRQLVAGQNRIPFFEKFTTNAAEVEFKRTFDSSDMTDNSQSVAVDACLHIFDCFGWNPARSQIQNDLEKYYARQFSE